MAGHPTSVRSEETGSEPVTADQRLQRYLRRREQALGHGVDARQWLTALFDVGSFVELDLFAGGEGDGAVGGWGTIEGRAVAAYALDPRHSPLGEAAAAKIAKVQELALRNRVPIVGAWEPHAERAQEGVGALAGMVRILAGSARASGVVPRLSVAASGIGPMTALADFVFGTGPSDQEVDFVATDDEECQARLRRLLALLPHRCGERAPRLTSDDPDRALPDLQRLVDGGGYEARHVVARILDSGELVEVGAGRAPSMVTGFGRLDGWTVGVVANQPQSHTGTIDGPAAVKAARFVRFCDAFEIPLITLVNADGVTAGSAELAKLIFAYADATVPKLAVVTGVARGATYWAMSPKQLGGDSNLAWPSAEVAAGEGDAVGDPYPAAERGYVDAVIEPRDTRRELVRALGACLSKRVAPVARKHDTMVF
jgi:acetyl-CoA carboxylase carboxyltransferase component